MKDIICGRGEFGRKLCEALNLDPKRTRSIDLHIRSNEVVTATVEHFIDGSEAESLINVLSAYALAQEQITEQRPVENGEEITPLGSEVAVYHTERDRMMQFFKEGGA